MLQAVKRFLLSVSSFSKTKQECWFEFRECHMGVSQVASHSEGREGRVLRWFWREKMRWRPIIFSFYCHFSVIPCSSWILLLKLHFIPKAVKAKLNFALGDSMFKLNFASQVAFHSEGREGQVEFCFSRCISFRRLWRPSHFDVRLFFHIYFRYLRVYVAKWD